MKTELWEQKKAEILRSFMEKLDQATPDRHDLFYVLHAIEQCSGFMVDQRFTCDQHTPYTMNRIREDLVKTKSCFIEAFNNVTETALGASIVSAQCSEGLYILSNLCPELDALAIKVEESEI